MKKLQPRERLILGVGVAFLVCVGAVLGVQRFALQELEVLDRQILARQGQLEELQELAGRHHALRARLTALEFKLGREQQESFYSRLGSLLNEAKLDGFLDGIQPQREVEVEGLIESTVEVKLSRVSLGQILELLRRLSLDTEVVNIRRLGIERRFESPTELDLSLVLSSYRTKAGA